MVFPASYRSISAACRNKRFLFTPTYRPGPGTYIDKPPVIQLTSSEPQQIGLCVARTLDECENGGSMPDFESYRSPVVDAAGAIDWDDFEEHWNTCVISDHGRFFLMTSDQLLDENTGYIHVSQLASDFDIGIAVLIALNGIQCNNFARVLDKKGSEQVISITTEQAMKGSDLNIKFEKMKSIATHIPAGVSDGFKFLVLEGSEHRRMFMVKILIDP